MAEPVRLVIWDLDETFWRGTLSEGGIGEYVQAHHDIVVALAQRGIISAICSKNDFAAVEAILRERGLWDYFVFPSIDWSPKAARIAAIIEQAQLRPATVLFIDDNPMNRAEAMALVPDLQIAGPELLAGLLADPRFGGKDDRDLTRLAQYKLLERRQAEQARAGGDNTAFLRRSGIRVSINTDIEGNIDRAIELINRTNQLNFTKARLPEDPAKARAKLRAEISPFYMRAGLVRVIDNYGDYGYCGFYCVSPDQTVHYCFSCRILGLGIETWLYERLGRPPLRVVGEVLTDLAQPSAADWISFVDFTVATAGQDEARTRLREVRLRGGCELDALAHYLRLHADRLVAETNQRRGPIFIRCDCTALLLASLPPPPPDLLADLRSFGYVDADFASEFLAPAEQGTLLVYSAWADVYGELYRHRATGISIPVAIPGLWGDLTAATPREIAAVVAEQKLNAAEAARVSAAVAALQASFDCTGTPQPGDIAAAMARLCDLVPPGANLFVILPFEQCRYRGRIETRAEAVAYNAAVRGAVAGRANVNLVDMNALVESLDELQEEFDHFDRLVYFRLFEAILRQVA